MKKELIVLVGPSGSGKTSIANALGKMGIPQVITHTTRGIRTGETPNVTYYYVTKEEFEHIALIEPPNLYAGNLYGMSKMELEKKMEMNEQLVVVPDINGLRVLKELYPEKIVSIYIAITEEHMEKRMRARGDSEENIRERIAYSFDKKELEQQLECDHVIYNDVLEVTIEKVINLINGKEEYNMNTVIKEKKDSVSKRTIHEVRDSLVEQVGAAYMQVGAKDIQNSTLSVSVKDMTILMNELERLEKFERDMKRFADSLVNI